MMPKKGHLELEERVERGGVERNGVTNLEDLGEIRLVKVSGKEDAGYGVWKGMLEERHYLHTAKLYGQQIKYLVESTEFGWIGAMAFSSAAWRVEVRDERLGWDEERRKSTVTSKSFNEQRETRRYRVAQPQGCLKKEE